MPSKGPANPVSSVLIYGLCLLPLPLWIVASVLYGQSLANERDRQQAVIAAFQGPVSADLVQRRANNDTASAELDALLAARNEADLVSRWFDRLDLPWSESVDFNDFVTDYSMRLGELDASFPSLNARRVESSLKMPGRQETREAQRRFWLVAELLNVCSSAGATGLLERVMFTPKSMLERDLGEVLSLQTTVELPASSVPLLVSGILRSPFPLRLDTLNVSKGPFQIELDGVPWIVADRGVFLDRVYEHPKPGAPAQLDEPSVRVSLTVSIPRSTLTETTTKPGVDRR